MKTVRGTVVALIPLFEVVHLLADDGERTMSIGEDTEGVDWRTLREGDVLVCELDVWEQATRVASARVVATGERS